MRSQTSTVSNPLISAVALQTMDTSSLYSDKLLFYCTQLSRSVETLRGSINKYESYREAKKHSSDMDFENDAARN